MSAMWIIQCQLVSWALVAYHPGGNICQQVFGGSNLLTESCLLFIYELAPRALNCNVEEKWKIQLMFLIFTNDNVVVVTVLLYGSFCTVLRN